MDFEIALPTFNCERWLKSFVDSAPNLRMVIRDDGSSDDTPELLKHLGRDAVLLDGSEGNLGMVRNFSRILESTRADWVLLADPDDVWLPQKMRVIGSLISCVRGPALVCTDCKVVDESLNVIADSYWRWSGGNPALLNSFSRMLVDSCALTCTIAANRALLDIALPIPQEARAPDWWLALVASAFGEIRYSHEATALYRRHQNNDSATPLRQRGPVAIVKESRATVTRLISEYSRQAQAFASRYGREEAAAAGAMISAGGLKRRMLIASHGLWFNSAAKNLALMVLC